MVSQEVALFYRIVNHSMNYNADTFETWQAGTEDTQLQHDFW
jgi:hypothetical protein